MGKQEIEKVYLDEESVKVTNSRFIVGGQTFALAGITSVTGAVFRESKTGDYAFGFLGACLALYGLGGSAWAFLGGLVMVGLAYLDAVFVKKPTYSVHITTAGGETEALRSHDEGRIALVVDALNRAIIERG